MGIFDRIRAKFRPKGKKQPGYKPQLGPKLPRLKQPQRREAPLGATNAGLATLEDFVLFGEVMFVRSSNVTLAQYFPGENKMMVEFHGGRSEMRAYLYSDVNEDEAVDFWKADSKGKWVWDNLRVRGTRDQHRKPYVRVK